jgi:enamine deaminase RidA (YjgF/YER057c/UK114 family)
VFGIHRAEDDMSAEQRLQQLGIELPTPQKPAGTYVAGVQVGSLLYMSGCDPRRPDGSFIVGKLGDDLGVAEGYQAACASGLSMLANIRSLLGSLDRVSRFVMVLGMVNATADFAQHPKVIDGFSDLMVEVFGESARGGRAAVGMGSLSSRIAVEVEAVIEVRP